MFQFPNIDPVIFRIGPFAMRWYGLMYILGFLASYWLTIYQMRGDRKPGISKDAIDDLFFYLIIGLIVGARLGYAIFYNLGFYIENPLEILMVWHGGMSFHGGLAGAFIVGVIIILKKRMPFAATADLIIPTAPIGICLGRLGNFINGELFGKPTDVPWGMVFPQGGPVPRHPSQLYEAFFEGILLFVILWFYKDKKKQDGDVFAMFLILYGVFRTFCEFFRLPDTQLGFVLGPLSMGQVLSLIMVAIGLFLKLYLFPKLETAKR
ncbi:MAG: prolipoprotein diacylglyceryl transferase [Syntrophorhabdaceae bacterium]